MRTETDERLALASLAEIRCDLNILNARVGEADAVADLGRPEEIRKAFSGFQKYLYQKQAAAGQESTQTGQLRRCIGEEVSYSTARLANEGNLYPYLYAEVDCLLAWPGCCGDVDRMTSGPPEEAKHKAAGLLDGLCCRTRYGYKIGNLNLELK